MNKWPCRYFMDLFYGLLCVSYLNNSVVVMWGLSFELGVLYKGFLGCRQEWCVCSDELAQFLEEKMLEEVIWCDLDGTPLLFLLFSPLSESQQSSVLMDSPPFLEQQCLLKRNLLNKQPTAATLQVVLRWVKPHCCCCCCVIAGSCCLACPCLY